MSVVPAPTVRLHPRPRGDLDTNDCSDLVTREAITAELDALPFLGSLVCDTATVVAGSTEELVFTYTVGRSGIADSGWLKLCFRFYSDWDLQTIDPQARDYASARLVSRSLIGGASQASAATVRKLVTRYDVKGGERPFQKALLIHAKDGYLRPGDVIEIRWVPQIRRTRHSRPDVRRGRVRVPAVRRRVRHIADGTSAGHPARGRTRPARTRCGARPAVGAAGRRLG